MIILWKYVTNTEDVFHHPPHSSHRLGKKEASKSINNRMRNAARNPNGSVHRSVAFTALSGDDGSNNNFIVSPIDSLSRGQSISNVY